MNITAGISATKTGFELIKSVRELLRRPEVDAAEISARLLELQDLMLDARNALSEAEDEKTKLEARIAELTRMADFGKDFVLWNGLYWLHKVPYCPTCWDVDRKTVRLGGPVTMTGEDIWQCPIHKAHIMLGLGARPPH